MAQGARKTTEIKDGVALSDPITQAIADLNTNGKEPIKITPADTWESQEKPGLIFKLKKFPNMVIRDAVMKLPEPKVPTWHSPDKDREEPNPEDPKYKEDVREYNYRIAMTAINISLVLGTELVDVPEGMSKPQDTEWSDPLVALNIEIPDDKYNAYLSWVRWYALGEDELSALHAACRRFNGATLEVDVEGAAEELKSDSGGDTNTSAPVTESS